MDRYLNRYIVPPHSVQQQQQQHQLLSQQQAANQNVPSNGFYAHQLIQQQHQQQQQQQQQTHGQQQQPQQHNFVVGCYSNASGWTGVPLISTAASRRPRKFAPVNQNAPVVNNHYQPAAGKSEFDENAMSRLALHAHGAPLILTNSRYNRSITNNNNNKSGGLNKLNNKVPLNLASREDHPLHHHHNHHQHVKLAQNMGASVHHQQQMLHHQAVVGHLNDAHSVASDESGPHSGTTNSSSSSSSDTCLPRIIKPRKRRKKDRKPAASNPITGGTVSTTPAGTSSTGVEITAIQAPTAMNSGQLQVNSLMLDENARDFLNEIALMANAGTAFDFSGLPLIREQPQLPQLPPQQQQQQLPQQQQHFSSSNSDSSDSGINSAGSGNLSCSCRLCDPFCKIWAFPLRRSCSDNSAEIELNRAKDVGVIGSNRSNSFRSEWRSSPHSLEQNHHQHVQGHSHQQNQQAAAQHDFGGSGSSRKGSFSDSGDSGCDLLSGLTFCSEDILSSVNRELFMTPVDAAKEFKFPVAACGGGGGGGVGSVSVNSISGSGSPGSASVASDNSGELLLISELTKKLNEGLDLCGRSSGGSDSAGSSVFSSASDSVFSGSASGGSEGTPQGGAGADLFVNFDAISRNNLFSVNNISKLSNLLFDDGLTAPGLVVNSGQSAHNLNNNVLGSGGSSNGIGNGTAGANYIRSKNIQNLQQQQQHLPQPLPPPSSKAVTGAVTSTPPLVPSSSGGHHHHRSLFSDHQPFIFAPDADRGCEVLNCFDMVWSNNTSNSTDRKLLPVEE